MDKNKELQLEVVQDRYPRVNADNIGVTVEDGVLTLKGDVSSLFEQMIRARMEPQESRTAYAKQPYVAGVLVICRPEAYMLPLEPAHSTTVESWIDAPVTMRHDSPEIFLSARETEVLSLIATGQSNQEIAGQLCLALNTVKRHAYNIYAKLEAKNRTQAVSKARRLGLIS